MKAPRAGEGPGRGLVVALIPPGIEIDCRLGSPRFEDADRMFREAEEAFKLTNSRKLREAAEVIKSLQESKIVGTP